MTTLTKPNPCFSLGRIVATPGALDALNELNYPPLALINRHRRGDWGDLDDEDVQANNDALMDGSRLLSVYVIQDTKFCIITEAMDDQGDRAATTILLPSEY
jgi:hypothetical protein